MKKTLALLLAVVMLAGMVLTACGGQGGNSNTGGGSIRVNIETEPPELDPQKTKDQVSFTVLAHLMDGLVRLDENNQPGTDGAAEKWDISDDGLVYTFTLRDAKYSNGDTVKAEDFEYGIKRAINKDTAAPYAQLLYDIKGAQEATSGTGSIDDVGVKALDEKTLEITLNAATPYFLQIMALSAVLPCQEAFYEANKDNYGAEANKLLFNGPYQIKEWKHEDSIVLEKNPNYWNKDNIKIDTINMLMITDENTYVNEYLSGGLDLINVSGDKRQAVLDAGKKLESYSDGSTWYLLPNVEKSTVLANKDFRLAMMYAIDREEFIKIAIKNNSEPATGYIPTNFPGLKEDFRKESGDLVPTTADTTKAKEHLDKALATLGMKAEDIKIEFLCGDTVQAQNVAATIQDMIKKTLGITLDIVPLTFQSVMERLGDGDFEMYFSGWGADYNDPISFLEILETGNGNNYGKWSNAQFDQLISSARTEADAETRMQKFYDAEKLLVDEAAIIPVYYRYREWSHTDKLQGVIRRPIGPDPDYYWAYIK